MISEELLSEVLGINITHTSKCKLDNDLFFTEKDGGRYINIYELAHKIENWIESKDISIIRIKDNNLYEFYINAYIDENYKVLVFEDSITSDSKIDGIVAVAEFILNKVSK